MNKQELLNEFDALETDVEKWAWVKEHQETGIVIMLDNDSTYGIIRNYDKDGNDYVFEFLDFIGCDDGVFSLLEAVGINAECM